MPVNYTQENVPMTLCPYQGFDAREAWRAGFLSGGDIDNPQTDGDLACAWQDGAACRRRENMKAEKLHTTFGTGGKA